MRNFIKRFFKFIFVFVFLGNTTSLLQAQTYTLTQTATAGGGMSNGAGGTYNLSSTSGQSVAVNSISATPYSLTAGFWSPDTFAPTAANVQLGGRITTADGAGIRNIRLMLVGGNLSAPRYAQTGTFGNYRFDDLLSGETYILTINSKRFVFAEPIMIVNLTEDLTDLNFSSEP